MTNNEWTELLYDLLSNAVKKHRESKEAEYIAQRRIQIDEMLTTNFSVDEKRFLDEILFELGLASDRETEAVYQQGLRDCTCLLKNLGVLA